MCTNGKRIDLASKLCCKVNPYLHCVGEATCGGIFCYTCANSHDCVSSGVASEWVDPNTHVVGTIPEKIKYLRSKFI